MLTPTLSPPLAAPRSQTTIAAPAQRARIYVPIALDDAPLGDPRAASGDRLTDQPGDAWEPHLSPAGDRLVYLARPDADTVAIRLIDVDVITATGTATITTPTIRFAASNDRPLDLGRRFDDLDLPTFASDGGGGLAVLFAGLADGQWDIYRVPVADRGSPASADPDPSRLENLTDTPDLDEARPALSPDGRRLAYDVRRGTDPEDIAVLDLLSGERWRLTDHPAVDRLPAFTPDGRWLYFRSERTGRSQIFRVAVDHGTAERVSFFPANDGYATVSPDARTILFESDRGGGNGIYLMDTTGRNRRALLAGARYTTPRFGWDGRTIAFSAAFDGGGLGIHLLALPSPSATP